MVSKFNKNAIINGFIDYFCLVCEAYFATEEAAEQHMEKQVHKNNLESSGYMEKYKNDCIRKVKAGYFCEYCNKLLSTGTKVNLHIQEKMHLDSKGTALLKYIEDDVVAFNEVVIKEVAWHGFCGDTCAICNCDVEDFAEHKADSAHILKLVQGKIQFGPSNNLYRIVDDLAFQCLTCNKILALNTFEKHLNDSKHKEIYASCINKTIIDRHSGEQEKVDDMFSTPENQSRNPTPTPMADSRDENISDPNILDSISEFQKNDINIHLESESAFCKKCYVDVRFNYNEIIKHIDQHKYENGFPSNKTNDEKTKTESNNNELNKDSNSLPFYYPKGDSDAKVNKEGTSNTAITKYPYVHTNQPESVFALEAFADNNKIYYIAGNSEARCTACDVKLPATLKNMSEHVNGTTHKIKSAPVKKPKCAGEHLPKQSTNEFIKEVIHIENARGHDVVINNNYCLNAMSFLMIKKDGSMLTCLYCRVTFDQINIKQHIKTSSHDGAMDRTPVVLCDDDDEFVREIRKGNYHCGYCHMVVGDWSDFEEHVKYDNHKQMKKTMKYRLNSHRPVVEQQRQEHQMRMMMDVMIHRSIFPWHWLQDM